MAVEEGLQVVVAMILETLLGEDGVDIGDGFQSLASRFVVDDTDALVSIWRRDAVKTVDESSDC